MNNAADFQFDLNEQGILRPEHIAPRQEGFPETVIVCFHKRFTEMLQREFQTKVIGTHFAGLGYPIYEFEYSERKIGMYLSMQGGLATSVFMEETISRGASTFLFFGSCGALNSSLTQGKLIVPSKTFRDEGTSGHYMEKGD